MITCAQLARFTGAGKLVNLARVGELKEYEVGLRNRNSMFGGTVSPNINLRRDGKNKERLLPLSLGCWGGGGEGLSGNISLATVGNGTLD